MHRQINLTLPEETIQLIEQAIHRGESSEERLREFSRFIDEAVKYYITEKALANLQQQWKEEAIERAERDLGLIGEWYDLEAEAWHK